MDSPERKDQNARARRDRRVSPSTNDTNKPKTYRANAIPPHAHVQICTHHFARLSSCTRPPIIPRESMRQETKQIPCRPPHRTVTRHGSARRKAERSHFSKLRKTQAQEDPGTQQKGVSRQCETQPRAEPSAEAKQPIQSSLALKQSRLQVMSGKW
jgi:hypothetical protein